MHCGACWEDRQEVISPPSCVSCLVPEVTELTKAGAVRALRATGEAEDFVQRKQQKEGWSEARCGPVVGQEPENWWRGRSRWLNQSCSRSSRASKAPGLGRGRCLETSQANQKAASERVSKWAFHGLFSSLLLSPLTGTLADLLQPAVWTGQKLSFLHSHPLTSKDCYSAL